jgi:hypothetical protein
MNLACRGKEMHHAMTKPGQSQPQGGTVTTRATHSKCV